MAYKALEVAQHVINYSIENQKPVTNLKLQKVLYYIQAAFLVEKNGICFKEEIQHWRHGPVIPKVYSEYKAYTDQSIKDLQTESLDIFINTNGNFAVEEINYDKEKFLEEDINLINKVISSYFNMEPWDMVEKTHKEEPWINTKSNEAIDINSIRKYFEVRKGQIYGGR